MKYQNVEIHNVSEIFDSEKTSGIGMCRYPLDILDSLNKNAKGMSKMASACEIRAMLKEGGEAKVVLQAIDDNVVPPIVSVWFGEFCHETILLENEPTEIIIKQPVRIKIMEDIAKKDKHNFDPRLVRIRLPQIHTVNILSIEGDLSYPKENSTPSKTMLSYGSSITHGASCIPPEGTYAAQCANHLGYDLINLGLGGAAQMEMAIADHIVARTDWDIITLEMGINVLGWEQEKFHQTVDDFVTRIVEAHPNKMIFCIDLFTYYADYIDDPKNAPGFRNSVKAITNKFNSKNVIHIDGRNLLTKPSGLRTDLVHPSDNGMHEMGMNLASVISKHIG